MFGGEGLSVLFALIRTTTGYRTTRKNVDFHFKAFIIISRNYLLYHLVLSHGE